MKMHPVDLTSRSASIVNCLKYTDFNLDDIRCHVRSKYNKVACAPIYIVVMANGVVIDAAIINVEANDYLSMMSDEYKSTIAMLFGRETVRTSYSLVNANYISDTPAIIEMEILDEIKWINESRLKA